MSRLAIVVSGITCMIFLGLSSVALRAEEAKPDAKAIELFNGKDLTGWGYPTGEKFDGKTESDDKRYTAKDGVLTVNEGKGKPQAQLWTTKEFNSNFELRFDFRASVKADSGVFIRKPQLQVRDLSTAGPFKEPYKIIKNYKPQDWNEVVVTVKDGAATATVNGELFIEKMKVPATGGIGIESDHGVMEYRKLRLTELK